MLTTEAILSLLSVEQIQDLQRRLITVPAAFEDTYSYQLPGYDTGGAGACTDASSDMKFYRHTGIIHAGNVYTQLMRMPGLLHYCWLGIKNSLHDDDFYEPFYDYECDLYPDGWVEETFEEFKARYLEVADEDMHGEIISEMCGLSQNEFYVNYLGAYGQGFAANP